MSVYGAVIVGNSTGGLPVQFNLNTNSATTLSYIATSGTYTVASDENLKDNITIKTNY